ncbi:type II secretion system protein GspM [Tateyamaria omphalii]|uniref:type II secretion system protein GspM n=1 Tax=Tateyamaria omphalii TaxID=299262 RepID=UPI0016756696|nr:type II secretion system protein GspM [Tateyamaria omphalii]
MDGVIDWLVARSVRERFLMAVCFLFLVPVCVVFTVLLPLSESRAAALDARDDALALEAWVSDRARQTVGLSDLTEVARPNPIGSTGLEKTLVDANLWQQVSDLGVQEGGLIELTFEKVVFTALANWLSGQSPIWGYDIGSFRIEALDDPGRVSARIVLRPPT